MSVPAALPAESTLATHVSETLRLAGPVMIGRAGILGLVTVDTAMTGHAGAEELAALGIAMAPSLPPLLVGIGLLTGTLVLSAQAHGAGDPATGVAVWRRSLLLAAVSGALMLGIFQLGEPILLLLGQAPEMARAGGVVFAMLGWGMPAALLYAATTFYLEATNRPLPGMVVMLAGNVLNVALNWVLVFGVEGDAAGLGPVAPLGAAGAAAATSAVRWAVFLALAIYVVRQLPDVSAAPAAMPHLGRRLIRLGLPVGITHGMESSAFAAMVIFAGLLGPTAVASFQIAFNLLGLVFMGALGISTAASVRVAHAIGRHDRVSVRRAGWVAVSLVAVVDLLIGGGFAAFAESLGRLYSEDPAVLALAVPAIVVGGLALAPDGTQVTLIGALRGTGDVWPPTGLFLLSFWGVMLPLGYFLGVSLGLGPAGLMGAVFAGCLCASGLLALRFRLVARRVVEPLGSDGPAEHVEPVVAQSQRT